MTKINGREMAETSEVSGFKACMGSSKLISAACDRFFRSRGLKPDAPWRVSRKREFPVAPRDPSTSLGMTK
jgi:hypothetical protein